MERKGTSIAEKVVADNYSKRHKTKPHVAFSQEDISYFIYTSGSPGHEPGVYAAGSLSPGTGLAGYFLGLSAEVHGRAERSGIF